MINIFVFILLVNKVNLVIKDNSQIVYLGDICNTTAITYIIEFIKYL